MRQRHRQVHLVAWVVLAMLLPGVVLVALAIRRGGPTEAAAIQLAPPAERAPSSQSAPPTQLSPSSQSAAPAQLTPPAAPTRATPPAPSPPQ